MKPDFSQRCGAGAHDFVKGAPADVAAWIFLRRNAHHQRDFAEVRTVGGNPRSVVKKSPALGFAVSPPVLNRSARQQLWTQSPTSRLLSRRRRQPPLRRSRCQPKERQLAVHPTVITRHAKIPAKHLEKNRDPSAPPSQGIGPGRGFAGSQW